MSRLITATTVIMVCMAAVLFQCEVAQGAENYTIKWIPNPDITTPFVNKRVKAGDFIVFNRVDNNVDKVAEGNYNSCSVSYNVVKMSAPISWTLQSGNNYFICSSDVNLCKNSGMKLKVNAAA